MLITLTKEFSENANRIYDLEVDGDTVYVAYGFNTQEEMQTFKTVIEKGKAGRTVEEEAIVYGYKKVLEKINAGFEDFDGSFDKLEKAYAEVLEAVEERKNVAKAEKEAKIAEAKAEKAEAKAKEKAEREAEKARKAEEKAREKAEREAEKAREKAEREAEKARLKAEKEAA